MWKVLLGGIAVVAIVTMFCLYLLHEAKLKSEYSESVSVAHTNECAIVDCVVHHGRCTPDVDGTRGKARRYDYHWPSGRVVYEAMVYVYDTDKLRSMDLFVNRYELSQDPNVIAVFFANWRDTYGGYALIREEQFVSGSCDGALSIYRCYESAGQKPFTRRDRDLPSLVCKTVCMQPTQSVTHESINRQSRYCAVLAEVMKLIEKEK